MYLHSPFLLQAARRSRFDIPPSQGAAGGAGVQNPALRGNQFYSGPNRYQTLGILPKEITDEVNPNTNWTQGGSQGGPSRHRSNTETTAMLDQLLDMFPTKDDQIGGLLNRHPYEHNVNMFIEKLLD